MEATPFPVVPRGKGGDGLAQAHQVLGLTGENRLPEPVGAVVEGTDAQGVPGGQKGILPVIVQNQGELRPQLGEHSPAILPVQGEENLAVAVAVEGVLPLQGPAQRPEAVDLPVAHNVVPLQGEGLHPPGREVHDSQPLEPQPTGTHLDQSLVVRPPGVGSGKVGLQLLPGQLRACGAKNGTHKKNTSECMRSTSWNLGRIAAIRGAT